MLKTVFQLDYLVLQRSHILLVLINFNSKKKDNLLQMCTFLVLHFKLSHRVASRNRRKVSANIVVVANVYFDGKKIVDVKFLKISHIKE